MSRNSPENQEECNLRDVIVDKLTWAKQEKEKGLQVIEKQLQQIKENKEILSKLDTIISILTELLETKDEPKKE